ncbi:PREDICTED: ly6/PLAUR domain-containing protein 8 [Galeopterus variegatus]|uniref:Ly6/PLAUR domain-containing protein 8 n=1 Tax=Galeopterus variegatus TaxID=482537 RepID=A0ABM0S1F6_GALVR|nr:PREDICTED: ly6/PLAUR domain-containing protein 8 [Galeopterus variegatus]
MKGILVAGVITALAVAAVESLNCVQCNSWANSCVDSIASECPSDANISCMSSSTNSSLGGAISLYQNSFCSAENCSEETNNVAFSIHVSDEERFHFASQCCQELECNTTDNALAPSLGDVSSTAECPACYGSNESACLENPQICHGEQCVSLVAEFKNDTESRILVLKGCSNISDSICQFLSAGNQTVGGVIFQTFECTNATSFSPTSILTTTPNTGSKASLASSALATLLLLGLLF